MRITLLEIPFQNLVARNHLTSLRIPRPTGALRELRKDAVFMAEERDRERSQVDAERMESQRRFYTELESQAADLNSGGQRGINEHLKKAFKRKKH